MYQAYIDGEKELREINMEFHAVIFPGRRTETGSVPFNADKHSPLNARSTGRVRDLSVGVESSRLTDREVCVHEQVKRIANVRFINETVCQSDMRVFHERIVISGMVC